MLKSQAILLSYIFLQEKWEIGAAMYWYVQTCMANIRQKHSLKKKRKECEYFGLTTFTVQESSGLVLQTLLWLLAAFGSILCQDDQDTTSVMLKSGLWEANP